MPYDRQQIAALAFVAALVRGESDPAAAADRFLAALGEYLDDPKRVPPPMSPKWIRDPETGVPRKVYVPCEDRRVRVS